MNPAETAVILRQFNEWRRGDEDIPQFDTCMIGLAIDAAVEMIDRLEAAEKERDAAELMSLALRARIAEMERQEPVGVLHVGSYYGEELQDWEFEADQRVCDHLNERHVSNPTSLNLYVLPSAQLAPNAVAYLDLGVGGYMDIGTDLTDEELDAIPKGRHMLGIVGTYGVDGYFPAQPAPSVSDGWMQHAARMATLARKLREPDWHFESIREMQRELCALEEAALAAAPEAKP